MKYFFNKFEEEFIMFLLAYKFGTIEKNGEITVLATSEQIKEETKKILDMIYKTGE